MVNGIEIPKAVMVDVADLDNRLNGHHYLLSLVSPGTDVKLSNGDVVQYARYKYIAQFPGGRSESGHTGILFTTHPLSDEFLEESMRCRLFDHASTYYWGGSVSARPTNLPNVRALVESREDGELLHALVWLV